MAAIKVLQLDFVNVLLPAHFLMIWSRLGGYDRSRFESYLYDSGEHIEQWAHEASVVSSTDWPLLAHRHRAFKMWKSSPLHTLPDRGAYLRSVLAKVRTGGAVTAHDFPLRKGPPGKPGDWHRPLSRWALEHHFGTGKLAVRRRQKNFQRVYDLAERLLADDIHAARIATRDAQRELLRQSANALGVATGRDLADYYRMSPKDAAPRIEELVEQQELTVVEVEGWSETAFLARAARVPRSIPGASLLSPFDPILWFRPRALRLFGFDYRIEIYVPAAKRRWGYYVLGFRQGDRITARVDLKADRNNARLLVQSAYLENGSDSKATSAALADELRAIAAWLELDSIVVRKTSTFEKALARAI